MLSKTLQCRNCNFYLVEKSIKAPLFNFRQLCSKSSNLFDIDFHYEIIQSSVKEIKLLKKKIKSIKKMKTHRRHTIKEKTMPLTFSKSPLNSNLTVVEHIKLLE